MRLAVASVVAVLLLVPAAEAARLRLAGRVASDQGGFVRLQMTLVQVTADTYTGPFQCFRGPVGRCIAKRGAVTLRFAADGFESALTLANGVQCGFAGMGTTPPLTGNYACFAGTTTVDSGVFVLRRRHG
jgi:hypothetical protein